MSHRKLSAPNNIASKYGGKNNQEGKVLWMLKS